MISQADLGWLAGMFDGEGSVSIIRQRSGYYVQLSVGGTHPGTRERVKTLLRELGVEKIYEYDQKLKDPTKHRQSWHVRIRRFPDALIVADALVHLSTTKYEHWMVVREFCRLRGTGKRPYGAREHMLFEQSTLLNRRGPTQ